MRRARRPRPQPGRDDGSCAALADKHRPGGDANRLLTSSLPPSRSPSDRAHHQTQWWATFLCFSYACSFFFLLFWPLCFSYACSHSGSEFGAWIDSFEAFVLRVMTKWCSMLCLHNPLSWLVLLSPLSTHIGNKQRGRAKRQIKRQLIYFSFDKNFSFEGVALFTVLLF